MERPQSYAFLHGGGQGGWVWHDTIEALRAQGGDRVGTILALDVPGCGQKRDRDTSALGPGDVAAELLSDLQDAAVQDVMLVGHSMAGMMLPVMAAKQPTLFRRLIYVSACAPRSTQNALTMMGTAVHGSNSDEVGWPLDLESNPMESQMPLMFCNDMDDAETASFIAQLGKDNWPHDVMGATGWDYGHLGSIPASYVICLQDGVLPVAWQETFAARLQAQRIVRVDAGHQAMNTKNFTVYLTVAQRDEQAPSLHRRVERPSVNHGQCIVRGNRSVHQRPKGWLTIRSTNA